MKKRLLICAACLVGLFAASPVAVADEPGPLPACERSDTWPKHDFLLAQVTGDDRPMRGPGHRRGMGERMRQMKHLEQLRLLKMLELLELTEEQEVPFLTAFNAMRKEQRELEATSRIVTDSLAQELRNPGAPEERLNELADRVLALQNEKHAKMMAFVGQSRSMLTAEQIGKFIIFQRRFESELLERVGRFRRGPEAAEVPEDDG